MIAALLCAPAATANERDVRSAILDLAAATAGTYGDEGPRILGAIDALERAISQWDLEIERLAAAARRAPAGSGQESFALSQAYLYRGRAAEALAAADAAVARMPRNAALHAQRALALEALGRSAEGVQAFQTAWQYGHQNGMSAALAFPDAGAGPIADSAERAFSAAYQMCLSKPAPVVFPSGALPDPSAGDTPLLPPSIYAGAYGQLAGRHFAEAAAEFRRAAATDALLTDPAVGRAGYAAATAALRSGDVAEARRQLLALRSELPDSSEVHRILGLTSLVSGDRAATVEYLTAAIGLDTTNERARIVLARVLVDSGRDEDAERLLRDTLAALPGSRLAHWWLGWVYEHIDKLGEARSHLAQSAGPETLTGRHRILSAIGRLSRVQGDFSAIVPALERAAAAAPNDVMTRKELAFALLEQDRPVEAFRELVAACAMAPADPDVHAFVGRIHLDADRAAEAVPALRRALELAPQHSDARYALAAALLRLGDEAGAARERALFERASREAIEARRRQMAVDVLAEEAAVRTAEGFHDRAVALWQRVAEAEPDQHAHLLSLGAAQASAGRTLDAIETYERAARLDANPADAYARLAGLYAQVGRHDDSRRAVSLAERARRAAKGGGGD